MDWEQDIVNCLKVLRGGGLILYPTDTIWGIGCDATNGAAVSRIYQLKKRVSSKSLIVLLADSRDILKYVAAPDPQVFDYIDQAVKPTTFIFAGALGLADNLIGEDGSVGIRVVRDEFCRHLIKRLGRPLVSTSANFSGEEYPPYFAAINPEIIQGVDYCVAYRREDKGSAQPSVVVRLEKDGSLTVIRP